MLVIQFRTLNAQIMRVIEATLFSTCIAILEPTQDLFAEFSSIFILFAGVGVFDHFGSIIQSVLFERERHLFMNINYKVSF